MHDRNGTLLKNGDVVTVKAVVTNLSTEEGYCNVQLLTVDGRRPDGQKETIYAINTAVTVLHERPLEPKE